ncbi:hypothetical protein RF11_01639 [Thelohanellus kitauei]|uniref:Uncharacterized protein n=1 Tax=Thelohanellus kitauei TaxID=669202 RepID=A0A0C2N1G0_THEKT|nr:hypothetical protein RF11_01639 [Thelohanellus kitauei]
MHLLFGLQCKGYTYHYSARVNTFFTTVFGGVQTCTGTLLNELYIDRNYDVVHTPICAAQTRAAQDSHLLNIHPTTLPSRATVAKRHSFAGKKRVHTLMQIHYESSWYYLYSHPTNGVDNNCLTSNMKLLNRVAYMKRDIIHDEKTSIESTTFQMIHHLANLTFEAIFIA